MSCDAAADGMLHSERESTTWLPGQLGHYNRAALRSLGSSRCHSVLGQERLNYRDRLEQRIQIDFSLRVA